MGAVDEVKKKVKNKSFAIKDLPLFLKAAEEVVASDDFLQELLEHQDDIVIVMEVPKKVTGYLEIKDHKLTASEGKHSKPTITIQMNEDVAMKILTGEIDPTDAHLAGDINIVNFEVWVASSMSIFPILDNLREQLGMV